MKGVSKMNRLKELRKEKKQTQKEFAEDFGIALRTLQSWENGESQIKPDKAQALADFFGVSVGYLLGFTDKSEKFEDEEIFGDGEGHVYAVSLKRSFRQFSEDSLKELIIYLSDHGFYLSNNEIISLWENLYVLSVNHGDDLKTRLFQEVRKNPNHPERDRLEKDYSLVLNYEEGEELPLKIDFE
ncbi:helix-turn-helix domain-containing protein [Streptococcus ruminantium]|uniref:helix-turn-helix domain-containing protein n=1 Tax=Streptococcus ruminantium TaxID=1917441 RepID=UPI003F766200